MLQWANTYFLFAIVAAIFGFGGLLGSAVGVARILFVVFFVLFLASLATDRRLPAR